MERQLLVIFYLMLIGCSSSNSEPNLATQSVVLGNTTLEIPVKYLLPDLPTAMVPSSGLDKDEGALFRIPLTDLGIQVSKRKSGLSDVLIVLIYSAPSRLNPDTRNAWHGTGLYKKRIIEFDEEVNLYRVYPDVGSPFPSSWNYFKTSPEKGGDPALNWVASCLTNAMNKKSHILDGSSNCHVTPVYKTVESQITVAGENMVIREEIINKYLEMLKSWDKTGVEKVGEH